MEDYKKLYEQSQENHKKTIERAISWAKGEHPECFSEAQKAIEFIFPELKESESDDEKVRKTLIRFFKDNYPNETEMYDGTVTVGKALTWLEKQGEHLEKQDEPLENYDEAEKEKADFVGDGFIECHADFLDFKQGNTYWLEYIGDDMYNVRSDNLLGKTYHITPCQLYTVFKKLTWLEKQGERKPTDKIEIGKKYQCIASPRYSTFRRGEIYKPVDNFLCNLMNLCSDCFEPIEDSEHNPILDFKAKDWYVSKVDGKIHNIYYSVDKTEPKFKVGDWVVDKNGIVQQILSYNNGIYKHTNGYSSKMFEDEWRMWTIQDAKDGDILQSNNKPFIYNEYLEEGKYPFGYGGINLYGRFGVSNGLLPMTHDEVTPATKEQRDTLMKAMDDAGWEFDFEKKELKKIEPKHEDETTSAIRNEEAYKIGFIDGKAHAKEEMESSWSEEDDYNLQCIIAKVVSDIQNGNVGRNEELIDWLKSLKPNKDMVEALRTEYEKGRADAISEMELSWGEEDEKMVNDIIAAIDTLYYHGMVNWLKSLKDRYTWKPSKEQIMALRWVLNNIPYDSHKEEISGLLDQIKKL